MFKQTYPDPVFVVIMHVHITSGIAFI